jgi:hypothetical protein
MLSIKSIAQIKRAIGTTEIYWITLKVPTRLLRKKGINNAVTPIIVPA